VNPAGRIRSVAALLLALLAQPAAAHSFGRTYTLPVPVWMYLYGAAASLLLSFLLVGYFVGARPGRAAPPERELLQRWASAPCAASMLTTLLRGLGVAALALTIVAGLFGTQNPYNNIGMTLFWVLFCLGLTYFSALAGDWFSLISPFRVLAQWIGRLQPGLFAGRIRYPQALGHWPALLLYTGFIVFELFGDAGPRALAIALSLYLLLNLLGCWLIGSRDWFEYIEFFGLFLRLVARLAPLRVEASDGKIGGLWLRRPLAGLQQQQAGSIGLLLFILFMLSSTAFDGIQETTLWIGAFWKNLYQYLLIPLYGPTPQFSYETIRQLFLAYQGAALLLSPLLYLAVYALFLWLARRITRSDIPLREWLLRFGYSLLPIAFVYHFTHYYTLLQVQAPQLLRLASDPLGLGWDLFGSAGTTISVIPDLAVVWHVQVFAIIGGHIASVYLAHVEALRLLPDRRSAILSQLPMLLLMVGFTSLGLWILSLPLESGVPF